MPLVPKTLTSRSAYRRVVVKLVFLLYPLLHKIFRIMILDGSIEIIISDILVFI